MSETKHKTRQMSEYNFTYNVFDSGPPDNKTIIQSVLNPIFNRHELSVNDHVLILNHGSEYYNHKGRIIEILLLSQNYNKSDILKIKIGDTIISAKLGNVRRLPS